MARASGNDPALKEKNVHLTGGGKSGSAMKTKIGPAYKGGQQGGKVGKFMKKRSKDLGI